ncbi:MAG: 3-phosphoglycerate dehydrogenase, partial [Candidatus Micrarchaeota archaeon]|nr:3-phosphoglycerate dehydrogenase [Candidatus Micrarchaeota archaeon]
PELIANAKKLRIVARAGVGLDNVKLSADFCKERGITVINTPAASTRAVAELTMAFIGALMRKVGFAHQRLQGGVWEKGKCTGVEPDEKVLGIIGMGRIGREVARRAEAGYEMKIIYSDLLKSDDLPYEYYGKLDDMLPLADVVTIHAGGAQPLLTAERISKMKKGAYLINTARGALVDETALAEALKSGRLAGAALDVHVNEPKKDGEKFDSPLRGLDNVILTPHIGAATKEAQARIGQDLILQLKEKLGK